MTRRIDRAAEKVPQGNVKDILGRTGIIVELRFDAKILGRTSTCANLITKFRRCDCFRRTPDFDEVSGCVHNVRYHRATGRAVFHLEGGDVFRTDLLKDPENAEGARIARMRLRCDILCTRDTGRRLSLGDVQRRCPV